MPYSATASEWVNFLVDRLSLNSMANIHLSGTGKMSSMSYFKTKSAIIEGLKKTPNSN